MGELDGLTVLVTRPAHQAGRLCERLGERGARALRLPLLAIGAPRAPQRARDALRGVSRAQWLIVTSPNAARRLPAFLPAGVSLPPIACLGEGTQRALDEVGLGVSLRPGAGTTSEALLAQPPLSELSGGDVVVARGEGGRRQIETALRRRGVRVLAAAVYRRRPTYPRPQRVAHALAQAQVAVVTSASGLERLAALTPAAQRPSLARLQLVAPSARVVQTAVHLGFARTPLVPERVSDEGFVEVICAWHAARHGPRDSRQ